MILQQDPTIIVGLFEDREHAARLLARRLESYRNTNSIIMAVPRGGVPVGYHVALELGLPLEVVACRKVKHPGDRSRTIGSVCPGGVVIHDDDREIPREYIQHTLANLQSMVRRRQHEYDERSAPVSLREKTVIVVDDWLRTGDTLMACLKNIQKQDPGKIIVAVPIVTQEAIQLVRPEVNEVIFLVMDDAVRAPSYTYFPNVSEGEVLQLIQGFKGRTEGTG
jgi:predicted phosphoribosyltransferase